MQHIFCAKLENSEQQATAKLNAVLAALHISYDKSALLGDLSAIVSEDERTKRDAGDLGWIRNNRIAPDFTEQVFSSEVDEPKIIESKIGWHLILVNDKRQPKLRSFEDMKSEIMISLENQERRNNVEKFRITLRKQLADRIKINWNMLKQPWTQPTALEPASELLKLPDDLKD